MSEALHLVDGSLSLTETLRLTALEQVIDEGRQTFIAVGNALMEIRDSRLYRLAHGTFEDYCQTRWQFTYQRAHQLIEAARVSTMVEIPNERQARELVPLLTEPETLREAWAEASESGEPTALKVREAVGRRMDVHYSSQNDAWSTPQDLFDLVDSEFAFETDVCASVRNAKCARFFSEVEDGLKQDWTGVCWMNPPYGNVIGDWIQKAYLSGQAGATVVCLIPGRVDTAWWWDYARHGEVRFLRGRLKFGGGESGAPFPSVLVIFGRPASVVWWEAWR